jgi:serine/threonine protein phosphatase 1
VPYGMRVYAIGDIHGCVAEFERMLDLIAKDAAGLSVDSIRIVLLGDLIDRGPDSASVVSFAQLMAASALNVHFVMGNHEEVLLEALANPSPEIAGFFLRSGGRETLISYGIAESLLDRQSADEICKLMAAAIPDAHREFLATFQDAVVFGDFFFTHAGIYPDRPLDEQNGDDLRWIREPFLSSDRIYDKVVVHGHTIRPDIDEGRSRVGIDTGAYESGVLSALVLEADRHWYLQTPKRM